MKDWSLERRAQYEARKAQFEAELTGQAATHAAIEELEAGKGARFPSVDALMTDLHEHRQRRRAMSRSGDGRADGAGPGTGARSRGELDASARAHRHVAL
jgi:hypothetical protein